jgi:hypothetical protein
MFSKNIPTSDCINIPPVGSALFHVDRWTDMIELIVALHNFAKVLNTSYMFRFLRDEGSKHVGGFNVVM